MKREKTRGFRGGSSVKNPPANAGDMGLIPRPGRFQYRGATKPMCHSNLSYWSPHALEPVLRSKRGHCNEKSAYGNEKEHLLTTREEPLWQWRPSTAQNKK